MAKAAERTMELESRVADNEVTGWYSDRRAVSYIRRLVCHRRNRRQRSKADLPRPLCGRRDGGENFQTGRTLRPASHAREMTVYRRPRSTSCQRGQKTCADSGAVPSCSRQAQQIGNGTPVQRRAPVREPVSGLRWYIQLPAIRCHYDHDVGTGCVLARRGCHHDSQVGRH